MKYLILIALLWGCQQKMQTKDAGELQIVPVRHGSLVLQWKGKNLYIDPAWGAALYKNHPKPDMVIITHPHGDHCSPETLKGLATQEALLVLPKAPETHAKTDTIAFKERKTLENGQSFEWEGIKIEAMPMYNLPNDSTARHPKGWGNGYVITIAKKRIYISGDTEDIDEMRALKNIDIAFVCMNLPYTMSVDQAIDAVAAFRPKTVYPYHYRGKDPEFSDVQKFKAELATKAPSVEVILAPWY